MNKHKMLYFIKENTCIWWCPTCNREIHVNDDVKLIERGNQMADHSTIISPPGLELIIER